MFLCQSSYPQLIFYEAYKSDLVFKEMLYRNRAKKALVLTFLLVNQVLYSINHILFLRDIHMIPVIMETN